jgi:signal transduction histidine kinase
MPADGMILRRARHIGGSCRNVLPRRTASALLVCAIGALVVSAAAALAAQAPGEPAVKHVLIVSSYGNDLAPFSELSASFRSGLARIWPGPVQFHEISLEITRQRTDADEGPLFTYIKALVENRRPDLAVMIGGPASRFGLLHGENLFPSTPVLLAGSDQRLVLGGAVGSNDATVTTAFDPREVVETILRLLPETENVVVVVGSSVLEQFWRAELEREFQPFADRVRFSYWDDLSLEEMASRAAALPPRTAIFYVLLLVDSAGVPHSSDRALVRLHAVANAPIFGLFETQLGQGIVGGSLVSVSEVSRRCVEAAVGVLRGEPPIAHRSPPVGPGPPVFDWRELRRWGIPGRRLPPGGTVRFRPQPMWDLYRWPILGGLAVIGVLATLVVGLTLNRVRRRTAEREVRTLSRRLLTAFEEERSRLARELHDDVSQRLARLAIDAARIESERPALTSGSGLGAMREEIASLSVDIHALSRRLHPTVLDDLGLVEALRAEAARVSRVESVAVDLRLEEPEVTLTPDTSLCLYRVAQEALRNVARHARARRVEISLRAKDGGCELEVRDDGVGFDPDERRGTGVGHASMRERMKLVGGRLAISSVPNRGTAVVAWAPLAGAKP